MSSPPIRFTPARRQRQRGHGWSADAQRTFIDALAEHGSVTDAAKAAGMNRTSAYRLRDEPGARDFAMAWGQALATGYQRLHDIAIDRAINGVRQPVFYRGEQIGERIWFDNRLLAFLLRSLITRRFGKRAEDRDMIDDHQAWQLSRVLFAEKLREILKDEEATAEELRNSPEAERDEDWDEVIACAEQHAAGVRRRLEAVEAEIGG